MLALRRGDRRLAPMAQVLRHREAVTHLPEGRLLCRAGGRQEYRQFSDLAQPYPIRLVPTASRCEVRAGSVAFADDDPNPDPLCQSRP